MKPFIIRKHHNNIDIETLHKRIRKGLPEPDKCPTCHRFEKLELCNISNEINVEERYNARDPIILATYNHDLNNWFWSCRTCHMGSDGRLGRLIDANKGERNGMYGRRNSWGKHSEETLKQMREIKLGKNNPNYKTGRFVER